MSGSVYLFSLLNHRGSLTISPCHIYCTVVHVGFGCAISFFSRLSIILGFCVWVIVSSDCAGLWNDLPYLVFP